MTINAWRTAREDEELTLESLRKIGDHPLFTMAYHGPTPPTWIRRGSLASTDPQRQSAVPFGCSIFVGANVKGRPVIGRNFDWPHSPALVLFMNPPGAYASVSFVDVPDLGITEAMLEAPIGPDARRAVLSAPLLPLDGMNEHGLVVTMAAVPEWDIEQKPRRPTGTSVGVLRPVLDHARDLDEAVHILGYYNIDPDDEPPIHYLIADASGASAIVEFLNHEMRVLARSDPWQLMVNFNLSDATPEAKAGDWRWCEATQRLREVNGQIDADEAMEILSAVKQEDTQWSTVYEPVRLVMHAAMGRNSGHRYRFGINARLDAA